MYPQMENERKIKMNPIIIGGIIFGLIAIVLLVVVLLNVSKTNSYGDEIRIDNLSEEYSNLPQDRQDLIFHQLYLVVLMNLSENEEIPVSGAIVREDSAEYDYDEITKIYYGNFIVDIPEIEQSYEVQFEWSELSNNRYLGGYPVVITCLPKSLQIYKNDVCVGSVKEVVNWENAYQLDYTFGVRTSSVVRNTIGNYLMSERKNEGDYAIVVDETTLRKDKSQPDLVFSFEATLNENYAFDVVVRMDTTYGDEYVAIYVKGDNLAKGFVLTDDKSLVGDLSTWLKNISNNQQLTIETGPLEN